MRGRSLRKADRAGGGDLAARLTRCANTWLAQTPDRPEQERIDTASRSLGEQRALAQEFHGDQQAANAFCIELFQREEFAPLHFSAELVEQIIGKLGEPPVVEAGEEQRFSDYLRTAVLLVALPDHRRMLAAQLRRYLPGYVEAGQWREAVAIDYSAFRTSLGNEVTPFLAQMALAGLADYYDEREELEQGEQG